MVIGIAATMLGAGTLSYFGDSEISYGNTFSAGRIDLKIDVNMSTHKQQWPCGGTIHVEEPIIFEEKDLVPGDKIFNWSDIKPGDFGEATISIHVYSNDAWFWMRITNPMESGGILTEPEKEESGPEDLGDLAQYIMTRIWIDQGATPGFGNDPKDWQEGCPPSGGEGDNIWQPDYEPLIYPIEGTEDTLANLIYEYSVLFSQQKIQNCTMYYLGWEWWVPTEVGNVIQDDSVCFDIEFYAQQWRNNPVPQSPWD